MNPARADRVGQASLRSDACGVPTPVDRVGTPAASLRDPVGRAEAKPRPQHLIPEAPMLDTATTSSNDIDDWRSFDDREAREDAIAADLQGALSEPGF